MNESVKYARFEKDGVVAYGRVEDGAIRQLEGDLYSGGTDTGLSYPLQEVTLLTPVEPSKVIALAGNYRDHLGDTPVPEHPEPFYKPPSCLQRHEGPIVQPAGHAAVHYEAELVLVIGKQARDVAEADALDHLFGVTCGNDVSARDWQRNDVQWWRAKGSDTFGPCGPYIVSGVDYGNLSVELRVNGEVRQSTNTRNMIHGIPGIIAFLSGHITLEPGDLIFTGTPGKTEGLGAGDIVEVDIESVGILRNHVTAPGG